ncbi:MAG: aldehyde dehydrogenase family protein [Thermoplasmata archaeon]|nr:aldehyde dehydrogenase family protein [Thermoplasmata archaeon]
MGVPYLRMFIDGEWCDSAGGETFEVRSPATGEALARLPKANREDVRRAVDAAEEAQPRLARLSVKERAEMAVRITEAIRPNIDAWALDLTLEQGKPIQEARLEVSEVIPNLLWNTEDLKRVETPVLEGYSKPEMMYLLRREPLGTIGVITPWNYPWLLPGEFVVQALICGNSVIFKPASTTPISAVHFLEAMEHAGIPHGAMNLVTGPGATAGMELVENPKVDGICFTGETSTGEEISHRAGLKKVGLELGGSGPLIVLDDADLSKAARDIAIGCYNNAGQVCCANGRILVHEKVHAALVRKVVEESRRWRLGDPRREDSHIGSMNNEPTVTKVERHLAEGVGKGAHLLLGGSRAEGMLTPLYFPATVVDGVTTGMLLGNSETFGPVAPILEFRTLEEAAEIANLPRYGLSMAIHTANIKRAFTLARDLKAGQIVINDPVLYWDYNHPWGGFRRSGIGRVAGKWTIEAFTEIKTIILNVGESPDAVA